jgi:hypothetical protein
MDLDPGSQITANESDQKGWRRRSSVARIVMSYDLDARGVESITKAVFAA